MALFEDSKVKARALRLDLSGDPRAKEIRAVLSAVGLEDYLR